MTEVPKDKVTAHNVLPPAERDKKLLRESGAHPNAEDLWWGSPLYTGHDGFVIGWLSGADSLNAMVANLIPEDAISFNPAAFDSKIPKGVSDPDHASVAALANEIGDRLQENKGVPAATAHALGTWAVGHLISVRKKLCPSGGTWLVLCPAKMNAAAAA